jgi:hypothetical protein
LHYAVSSLGALLETTHEFELGYSRELIGSGLSEPTRDPLSARPSASLAT